MVSVQFILAIGVLILYINKNISLTKKCSGRDRLIQR
jgi:hypothetical protein